MQSLMEVARGTFRLAHDINRIRRSINDGGSGNSDLWRDIKGAGAHVARRDRGFAYSSAVGSIQQISLPYWNTGTCICVESVQAIVLGGDEHYVVSCPIDVDVRRPKRLGIDLSVGGTGKQF